MTHFRLSSALQLYQFSAKLSLYLPELRSEIDAKSDKLQCLTE